MFIAIRERLNSEEEGFTLIELLVVVIIIGILAAIAIPTFLKQRERGYQAELTSSVRNYALDIEAQATAANGIYPGSSTLPANLNANGAVSVTYTPSGTAPNYTGFSLCGTTTKIEGANNVRYVSGEGVKGFATTSC